MSDSVRGIGDNNPPEPTFVEILTTETAEIDQRITDLLGGFERAKVTDRESAGRATLLAGMMKDHLGVIAETHDTLKRPHLQKCREVDAHFNVRTGRLAIFDSRKKLIGGPLFAVLAMVDKFRLEEEARAAAERRRLAEEARIEREKAEAAERARREAEEREEANARAAAERVRRAEEEAQLAGTRAAAAAAAQARAEEAKSAAEASERRLAAEVEQRRSEANAAALEHRAATTTAAPIDSGFGVKASGKKVYTAVIDDLSMAIRHARRVDEATIRAAVQQIFDRQVRAGVRVLPGARVIEGSSTQIRSLT